MDKDWKAYEFKFKPGDGNRRPRSVAPYQPYQPRLDWQNRGKRVLEAKRMAKVSNTIPLSQLQHDASTALKRVRRSKGALIVTTKVKLQRFC